MTLRDSEGQTITVYKRIWGDVLAEAMLLKWARIALYVLRNKLRQVHVQEILSLQEKMLKDIF